MRVLALFLVASLAALPSVAQTAATSAAAPSPATQMGAAPSAAIVSPEIHSDGTVTLRMDAPNAKAVTVTLEGSATPLPLTLNPNTGVWEVTTPTMTPEYYGYSFSVDGKRALDPHNAAIRPNLLSPTTVLHVPASTPQPWDRTDIPHGEVHHHWYQSKLAVSDSDRGERDLWVYTPPNYDPKRKEKYPVLYLNHGYSDAANGWVEAGQANLIFDALLQDGRIKPMVVVMPLGYGTLKIVTSGWGRISNDGLLENQKAFTDQLLHEVMPMVEAKYDIARDPAHRAIAGLSMGGGHSIATGLNHPEIFGYVGAFSSAVASPLLPRNVLGGTPPDAATYEKAFAGIVPHAKTQPALKLFWLSCGTEDSLITVNRAFGAWAKTNIKGNVQVRDTPGMHTWMVWRDDLIAFTPLLFHGK